MQIVIAHAVVPNAERVVVLRLAANAHPGFLF